MDGGSAATYVYNALNQRVRDTVGSTATEYVFNAAGQRVSEWNGATRAQLKGKYYWGAKPVAYYDAGGATHFEHQDWLGTERIRTAYNGGVEGTYQSLPFGDGQATTGADTDANHFAQLDQDAESGTAHAQQRQDSNAQGRWLSPDPYQGSYQMRNPQSFNRYVYAMNNPLAAADPSGLIACLGVRGMGGGRGFGVRALSVGCYYDGGEGGGSGGTGDEEFAFANDPSNTTDTSNTTVTSGTADSSDEGGLEVTYIPVTGQIDEEPLQTFDLSDGSNGATIQIGDAFSEAAPLYNTTETTYFYDSGGNLISSYTATYDGYGTLLSYNTQMYNPPISLTPCQSMTVVGVVLAVLGQPEVDLPAGASLVLTRLGLVTTVASLGCN